MPKKLIGPAVAAAGSASCGPATACREDGVARNYTLLSVSVRTRGAKNCWRLTSEVKAKNLCERSGCGDVESDEFCRERLSERAREPVEHLVKRLPVRRRRSSRRAGWQVGRAS